MTETLTPYAKPIKRRSLVWVGVLSVITVGIYWFYLVYQWSKEMNGLLGEVKFRPGLMLLISICTLGVGGTIIECIYAHEIEKQTKARGIADPLPYLFVFVVGLNAAAFVLGFVPGAFLLSIPLGVTATVLVQNELNKLAPLSQGGCEPPLPNTP